MGFNPWSRSHKSFWFTLVSLLDEDNSVQNLTKILEMLDGIPFGYVGVEYGWGTEFLFLFPDSSFDETSPTFLAFYLLTSALIFAIIFRVKK